MISEFMSSEFKKHHRQESFINCRNNKRYLNKTFTIMHYK